MPRSRMRTSIRWFSILLVLGLGATAVGLVVLGSTQKQLRIGVLVGIWAAVVAYFLPGRASDDDEDDVQLTGHEIATRTAQEVAARSQVNERREYERALQRMLRAEIDAAMRAQVTALRGEVAALRSDLVENVNGQLRLERTETTRVIGSDIEALQREIRRLAVVREPVVTFPAQPSPPPATARPAPVVAAPLEPAPESARPTFPPRPASTPTAATVTARTVAAPMSTVFPPLDLPPLPAARAIPDLPPVSVTPPAVVRPAPLDAPPARPPVSPPVRPSAPAVVLPAAPAVVRPAAPAVVRPAAPAVGRPAAPAVVRPAAFGPPSGGVPGPAPISPAPAADPPPATPVDPFGELPRLGIFRDADGNHAVPTRPEGYVGRRRVPPSDDVGDILGRAGRR